MIAEESFCGPAKKILGSKSLKPRKETHKQSIAKNVDFPCFLASISKNSRHKSFSLSFLNFHPISTDNEKCRYGVKIYFSRVSGIICSLKKA